ncbi:ABC transporter permease subunit [Geodermatophilus sp. YIM 151500]|uniref:PhnE/PtxC family ABC transporter permease n=1 Tax=Geodermatophilus sp. YIM 151500 TaxID=2984531 RepID=UPI0021E499EE|nr:ABC transporter permease subunit [Geodermatophilus sp. YIM 151500]MCV2490821.1 ABC transporter permease subunit [Geodermatophilus sp. YIM 151500]
MTGLLDAPRLSPAAGRHVRLGVTRAAVLRRRGTTVAVLAAVLVLAAWRAFGAPGGVINTGGAALLDDLLARALSPRLDAEFLLLVARATATTLAFAAVGAAGALLVGLLGGLALSDAAWSRRPPLPVRLVRTALRGVLVAARSVHELVWALLLVGVLGLDPLVAVLALVVPFGAQTAQVYAETFDGVRGGAHAALRRAGAPRTAAILYALVPGASPLLLSYAFYRFECSLRSTVLLGLVGVGGLGQELVVSLQSRNWEEVWTLVLALLVLSALVEAWSARVRREAGSLGDARPVVAAADAEGVGALAAGRADSAPPTRTWTRWSVLVGLPGLAVAWWWTGASLEGLTDSLTWQLTQELVADLLRPALPDGGGSVLLLAVLDTLAIAVLAMAVAVLLTVVLAPWAAAPTASAAGPRDRSGRTRDIVRAAPRAAARLVSRTVLLGLRSVPPTIWAILALFVFFPGVVPGAVALGLYAAGILGRLVAEAWESVDRRPRDALVRAGVAPWRAGLLAVVPPSVQQLTTYTMYRFEVCVRDTAVVGVVGAAGLGRLLGEGLAAFRYPVVATALLASFAVSVAVELTSRRVRRGLSGNLRPRARPFRRAPARTTRFSV